MNLRHFIGEGFLTTAVLKYTAAAATDRGRRRSSNEDAFGYSVEHGVYVVCDGMGGAAAGEIASSLAVDELMRQLTGSDGQAPILAEDAISAANQAIYSRAQRNHRLSGMGTTMVMLTVNGPHLRVLNVGDSRCYRFRNRHLQQITQDHSLVEEQIRAGHMTRSEAQHSPFRNVITRALGTNSQINADLFELDAQPHDLYLICTDGLSRELSDTQIAALLIAHPPLDELCAKLIRAANKAGGSDNITCLLVQVE